MKLLRSLDELTADLRGGAVAIGNFDGVHRGHARIVERLLVQARRVGGPGIVFTFDPHPVRLLRPEACPPPLTWTDRKADLLSELGVDAMIAYPTNEALLSLSPEVFFQQIVRQALDARAIVEGPNFYFGRGRAGDIASLGRLCGEFGLTCVIRPDRHQDPANCRALTGRLCISQRLPAFRTTFPAGLQAAPILPAA